MSTVDTRPDGPGDTPILKLLLRLAFPLAMIQLGQVTMGLVDTAMLGRVSAADLAAAGIGNAVFFGVIILGMGIVLGAETLTSQAVGANDHQAAARAYRQGVLVALMVSLPLGFATHLVMVWALPFAEVAPEVSARALEYVHARLPGLPAFLIYIAQRAYVQAYGKTRAPTLAMIFANAVNVPADFVMIFGDGGLARLGIGALGLAPMGAMGAGYATSVCAWIQVLVVTPAVFILAKERGASLPGAWGRALRQPGKARIIRLGLPVGLQYALEVNIFALIAIAMGRISTQAAAANQVALNLVSTSFSVVMGISIATSVLVGRYVGAQDRERALTAGVTGVSVGAAIMAFSGAMFFLVPEPLARLFSDDPEVIAGAVTLMRIAAFFQIADGVQAVACGALRGAGDTDAAFIGNLIAYWVVGLPVAYLLGFHFGWGAPGLWWGLTAGLVVAATGLTSRFVIRARRGYVAVADGA